MQPLLKTSEMLL